MKDLIAKLKSDATCAMGALWIHIDSREAHIDAQAARIAELEEQQAFGIGETYANALSRIAELEAQIAGKPAGTDKLWEAILALSCNDLHAGSAHDDVRRAYREGFDTCRRAASVLAASKALQAPVREVPEGMPVSQEPKYGIRENRLFNRASGETIPEDEPVFIFRARDTHAVNILAGYAREVLNAEHASAVWGRVDDFKRFWDANPDRMKQPDTALPAAPVQEPKP